VQDPPSSFVNLRPIHNAFRPITFSPSFVLATRIRSEFFVPIIFPKHLLDASCVSPLAGQRPLCRKVPFASPERPLPLTLLAGLSHRHPPRVFAFFFNGDHVPLCNIRLAMTMASSEIFLSFGSTEHFGFPRRGPWPCNDSVNPDSAGLSFFLIVPPFPGLDFSNHSDSGFTRCILIIHIQFLPRKNSYGACLRIFLVFPTPLATPFLLCFPALRSAAYW